VSTILDTSILTSLVLCIYLLLQAVYFSIRIRLFIYIDFIRLFLSVINEQVSYLFLKLSYHKYVFYLILYPRFVISCFILSLVALPLVDKC